MKKKLKIPFDKYSYYLNSVQCPEADVEFVYDTYKKLRKKAPQVMREDFCGTFAISCEWVKYKKDAKAWAVDLDMEPIEYGKKNYLSKLTPSQKERLNILKGDVLKAKLPKADIACGLNFSYYCIKKRQDLKTYFSSVYKSLNPDGIFILDCFGGSQCYEAIEEETEFEDMGFSYFWDQTNFNPITNEAKFYIHFKPFGEKKRTKVFTYDWRMWSPAELSDILSEAGFTQTLVYWEGTDKEGEGNGIFKPTQKGEECDSWIAYLVALK